MGGSEMESTWADDSDLVMNTNQLRTFSNYPIS